MSQTRVPFKKFTEGDFIYEIRRLNRVISKLSYERDDLQQENKQLKHILDELEKWLEEESNLKGSETSYLYYGKVLDKIKELRGRENENKM